MLLLNQMYAGIVDVPEYGVRAKRGDFESLRGLVLSRAVSAVGSRGDHDATAEGAPDFPLRAFVRCAATDMLHVRSRAKNVKLT